MQNLGAKHYIIESFFILLAHHEFEEISVRDLVKKAGISRSTFYLHFSDKFALLGEVRRELNTKFLKFYQDQVGEEMREISVTVDICSHILQYRTFYELEFSKPESIQRLSEQLTDLLKETFDDEDYAIFASYGTIGYLTCWVKEGFVMSPREAGEKLLKIGFTDWSMKSMKKYDELRSGVSESQKNLP